MMINECDINDGTYNDDDNDLHDNLDENNDVDVLN